MKSIKLLFKNCKFNFKYVLFRIWLFSALRHTLLKPAKISKKTGISPFVY